MGAFSAWLLLVACTTLLRLAAGQSTASGLCYGSAPDATSRGSKLWLKSQYVAQLCTLLEAATYANCTQQLPELGVAEAQVDVGQLETLLELSLVSYCTWDGELALVQRAAQPQSGSACPPSGVVPDWALRYNGQGATAFILGQGVTATAVQLGSSQANHSGRLSPDGSAACSSSTDSCEFAAISGPAGLAQRSSIVALQTIDSNGTAAMSDLLASLQSVAQHLHASGPVVVLLPASLGDEPLLQDVLLGLRSQGALVIALSSTAADSGCASLWNGGCVVPTPLGLQVATVNSSAAVAGQAGQVAALAIRSNANSASIAPEVAGQAGQLAALALQFYGQHPHAGPQQAADKIMEAAAADYLAQRATNVADANDFVVALPGRDFSSAILVPALPFSARGVTYNCTNTYTTDPAKCGSSAPGGDVVYLYMPAQDESVTVDICGSAQDAMVHVYEGTAQQLLGCATVDSPCSGNGQGSIVVSAKAGQLYYVVVDSASPWYSGTYRSAITRTPAGDLAATALAVSSLPFSANGTTLGLHSDYSPAAGSAGASCGDALGPDVVYQLQVSWPSYVAVSLCAQAFDDAVLQIYKGDITASALAGCNRNSCGAAPALRMRLAPNTTYYIVISGRFADAAGAYQLDIATVPEAAGNSLALPKVIPALPFSDIAQAGSYSHDYPVPCGPPTVSPDTVYELRLTQAQYVDVSSCESDASTQLWVVGRDGTPKGCDAGSCGTRGRLSALYFEANMTYYILLASNSQGLPGPTNFTLSVQPSVQGHSLQYPWVVDAIPFSHSNSTLQSADNIQSTSCSGGTGPDTTYRLDSTSEQFVQVSVCGAAFDVLLYVYQQQTTSLALGQVALSQLGNVGCNHGGCSSGNGSVLFVTLERGYSYFFVVDGWQGAAGDYTLTIDPLPEPYGNRFDVPQPAIQSLPYEVLADTSAFANDYTPPCAANSTAPDIMYVLDLALPGFADIQACSTAFAPVLHAYRGQPGANSLLGCALPTIDSDGRQCSLLQLEHVQTDLYSVYVVVDGVNATSGVFDLTVTEALRGDYEGNTKVISSLPYSQSASTAGYLPSESVGTAATTVFNCTAGGPDVFYSFTPPKDVYVAMSLRGGSNGSGIGLFMYEGQVNTTQLQGCTSIPSSSSQVASLEANLKGGSTYYVVVAAASTNSTGSYTLEVQATTEAAGNRLPNALPITGLPFAANASTAAGFSDDYSAGPYMAQCGGHGAPDIVYALRPNVSGIIEASLCGSSYATSLYVMNQGQAVLACACTPGCGGGMQSLLRMYVEAGSVYYLVVDGFSGWADAGRYELSVRSMDELPGNSFDNPKGVDTLPFTDQDTTANYFNTLPAGNCSAQVTPNATQHAQQVIYRLDGSDLICSVDIQLTPGEEDLVLAMYEVPEGTDTSARQQVACIQVPFTATLQTLTLPTKATSTYFISIQGSMMLTNFTLNVLPTRCLPADVKACAAPAGSAQTEALTRQAQFDPLRKSQIQVTHMLCAPDGVAVAGNLTFTHPVDVVDPSSVLIDGGAGTVVTVRQVPSSCGVFALTAKVPKSAYVNPQLQSTPPVCISLVSGSTTDEGGVIMPAATACRRLPRCTFT